MTWHQRHRECSFSSSSFFSINVSARFLAAQKGYLAIEGALSVNRLKDYACERFLQRIEEARTCRNGQFARPVALPNVSKMGNLCAGFSGNESTCRPIPLMEAALEVSIE
jgi:hypothetical protein